MAWGFVAAGLNVLLQGVCQALGGGTRALAIASLRLVVLALPLAAAIAQLTGSVEAVWWAFPVAEALTLAVALELTRSLYCACVQEA